MPDLLKRVDKSVAEKPGPKRVCSYCASWKLGSYPSGWYCSEGQKPTDPDGQCCDFWSKDVRSWLVGR